MTGIVNQFIGRDELSAEGVGPQGVWTIAKPDSKALQCGRQRLYRIAQARSGPSVGVITG
jgi:hypothetical protein